MIVSPRGVNDLTDLIKRFYWIQTLTELWDVTLSIKRKKKKKQLLFLASLEGWSDVLDPRIMNYSRITAVFRFWYL